MQKKIFDFETNAGSKIEAENYFNKKYFLHFIEIFFHKYFEYWDPFMHVETKIYIKAIHFVSISFQSAEFVLRVRQLLL